MTGSLKGLTFLRGYAESSRFSAMPLVRKILLQVFVLAHTPLDPTPKPSQQHATLWLETSWHSRKCLALETDAPGSESQLCHMFWSKLLNFSETQLHLLCNTVDNACLSEVVVSRIRAPKDVHTLSPRIGDDVTSYGKRDFASYGLWDGEVIWTQPNHRNPSKWRSLPGGGHEKMWQWNRNREMTGWGLDPPLLTLKVKGDMRQGIRVASGSWKRPGNRFSLGKMYVYKD